MAFCHIYERRDGKFRVRMNGTISLRLGKAPSAGDPYPFLGGTVTYTTQLIDSEREAREWIQEGRERDGLEDMPEPKVIRR